MLTFYTSTFVCICLFSAVGGGGGGDSCWFPFTLSKKHYCLSWVLLLLQEHWDRQAEKIRNLNGYKKAVIVHQMAVNMTVQHNELYGWRMPLCGKCLIPLLCELSPQITSPDPGKLCFDWAAAPTSHVLSSSDITDLPALSFLLPPSLPWIFLLFFPSQMWCCIGSSVSWMWILVRCWAITRIDLLHLANLGMLKR